MKKLTIFLITVVLVLVFNYFGITRSVEYETVAIDHAPALIQEQLNETSNPMKFSIFEFGNEMYIYYKTDHLPNEYITTDLDVKKRSGKYIVTATVRSAINDDRINYDQLIKIDGILDKDIIFKESIKR